MTHQAVLPYSGEDVKTPYRRFYLGIEVLAAIFGVAVLVGVGLFEISILQQIPHPLDDANASFTVIFVGLYILLVAFMALFIVDGLQNLIERKQQATFLQNNEKLELDLKIVGQVQRYARENLGLISSPQGTVNCSKLTRVQLLAALGRAAHPVDRTNVDELALTLQDVYNTFGNVSDRVKRHTR